jgi:CheY-like chemotaxis protein
MANKVLLVEDNPHKQSRILEFLELFGSALSVHVSHSFTSGCKATDSTEFDLLILDMSLPTYDRSSNDSGGRFRILGGREIARRLARRGKMPPMIFLTQYSSFSDKGAFYTFESLTEELILECDESFRGMVFFETTASRWKQVLSRVVKEIIK